MRKITAALALLCLLMTVCAAALAESPVALRPDMPAIRIDTDNGSSEFATRWMREDKLQGRIDYVDAFVSVEDCEADFLLSEQPAQVKVRGNWTLEYPKKSIRIKFDRKQGMLGLNEAQAYRNWVLLAERKDLSLTNSAAGLYLAQAIVGADGYYCTDFCPVEVWINGEYWGVYLLAEQQEVNSGRVAVAEPDKDYTGTDIGYFFEYDAYFFEENNLPDDAGDPTFEIYHEGVQGEQYGYTIKSDINADRQRRFLSAYVRRVYQIARRAVTEGKHYAFTEDHKSLTLIQGTSVQETVGAVIDLTSLVDMYILNEIVCNPDVGWSSFYLSLDMSAKGNGKLTFEAPWDFDSCFGIRSGYERNTGLYAANSSNPWLTLFVGEEWFQEMVRQRWAEIRAAGIPENTLALIREMETIYADEFARNHERWESRVTQGNHELIAELNACTSQGEAAAYLKRWLEARFAYLDSQWNP